MNIIEKSLEIALHAYRGKTDKAGKTYILHPLRVMAAVEGETAMATALLHDVIEDSDVTDADLARAGIPSEVIAAVVCLTRQPGEEYSHFIERILTNQLAVQVKIADIEDNINVLRLRELSERDFKRIAKYHQAWQRLRRASVA